MRSFFVRPVSVLAVLSLFGSGCGSASSVGSAVPAGGRTPVAPTAGAPTPAPTAVATDACSNRYYPLKQGLAITYTDTFPSVGGSGMTTSHYTWSVTDRGTNEATTKLQFDAAAAGMVSTQHIRCTDGQIATTSYVDFSGSGQNENFETETRAAHGFAMPSDISPGTTWEQSFEVVLHPRGALAGVMHDITMLVTLKHTVVGAESVTVPAGTYQAMKVQTKTTFVRQGAPTSSLGAAAGPGEMMSAGWWVKDIGLVKTVIDSGDAASGQTIAQAETIVNP